MSDDTDDNTRPSLEPVNPLWRARELVITAARAVASEHRTGRVDPDTLELLAIATERLVAARAGGAVPDPEDEPDPEGEP